MNDLSGPFVKIERSCMRCRFLRTERSPGKFPEYFCDHEEGEGKKIGCAGITPIWCPFWVKATSDVCFKELRKVIKRAASPPAI